MLLVVCGSDDAAALWACEGLRRRGLEPIERIWFESLAHGVGWEHRLEDGRVWTGIVLGDGRRINSEEVSGVLNRISTVHSLDLGLIHPSDQYYVAQELQAFLLSWLHALPAPVLNRPTPLGLSGRLRHASEWVWLASKAGLPNPGYTQSSNDPPLQWSKLYNMYADWNIIYGFPGEQVADYEKNLEMAKLLTHLNPPGGLGVFRMDRFSTNFEKAPEMGFTDVRPHPVYRFIYPFPEETLSNLVYFFDYKTRTKIDDGGYVSKLSNEVSNWKARRDRLVGSPVGDTLVVNDTRPVAVAPEVFLDGVRKDAIEFCDRARTADQLHQELKKKKDAGVAKEEITKVLEELVRDKLMVREGSWYLSLPVMPHLA